MPPLRSASAPKVGRRIVEFEQGGTKRAGYGEALLGQLSAGLSGKFGRGFSLRNLYKYRQFFLNFPEILPTVSGEFVLNNPNAQYVVKNGKRTAVILPLAEYEALLEDVEDLGVIASRKDEPAIPLDRVKRRLKSMYAVRFRRSAEKELFNRFCRLKQSRADPE